jgi:hypothetical protein
VTFIHTDSVTIKWHSETALTASVRDAAGIWDQTWTAANGWVCTCLADQPCTHSLAIRAVAMVAT